MNEVVAGQGAQVVYILIAFLAGGGTVVAAIALLANSVLKSPVLVTALENLAKSASPELLASLNVSAKLVDEITDNVPFADKGDARG